MKKQETTILIIALLLGLVWFWAARPPTSKPVSAKSTHIEQKHAPAVKKCISSRSRLQKKDSRPKPAFTQDKDAKFNLWHDDITNMTCIALANNDIDALEEFLEFLREKDDWKKVKSLADAMFLVKDWQHNVPEDAQDSILDILSEYAPHTLPEMVRFLESEHEDVRENALDDIAGAIEESEDEKSMCSFISMLSDVVEDAEFAERMIEHMDMMDLTHDVSNTMMHMLSKGTPAFKKALSDFLIEGEYSDSRDKTALAYGVGKWLSGKLADEND